MLIEDQKMKENTREYYTTVNEAEECAKSE